LNGERQVDDRVFPKLSAKRQESELLSNFSRQDCEGCRRFGHEVDDALLELADPCQGEIESLGPLEQPFEGIDYWSGQVARRKERKYECEVRRNAGRSAWIVLHPELAHQLAGLERRDKNNAFELILQSAPL
jgi:hypothetical protein